LADTTEVYSSQLTISDTHTDLSCYESGDGSVDITVGDGFSPYTYSWYNNNGSLNYITQDLNNIPSDTFMVDVIDSIGCHVFDTVIVTQPTLIVPNEQITNVLCHDDSTGSIILFPTGGSGDYTYSWAVPDSSNYNVTDSTGHQLTGMIGGVYMVTITDSTGCYVSHQYEITQPTQISLTADIIDNVCWDAYAGSIDLNVQGGAPAYSGYTYHWEEQNDSIVHYYDTLFTATTEDLNHLHAGVYTVTVTDMNGCVETETYQVQEPFQGLEITPTISDVSCKDQHDGQGFEGHAA
jgi:hypothetical protein